MESTIAGITKEQLRTFHIAGRGLDFAVPTTPLRPAALDLLPKLPPVEATNLRSLYASALTAARGAARAAFLERIRQARGRLTELLALDDLRRPEAASPAVLSAALGSEGHVFFDAGALAAALGQPAGHRNRMGPGRRARIEDTIATFDAALLDVAGQPPFYAFEGQDSFQAALEFCDRMLERFADVLRGLRLARLENESAFNTDAHEEALNRLDWQSATYDELLALPPVVVFETADRLAGMSLTSFGRVLRSGRPIQIVVDSPGLYAGDLSGFVPDFGYIAIAHREAFVLQSSVSRPERLASGLAVMARTLRPAVAVVAVPETPDQDAYLATSLLHLSRAFPLYLYDPDRGETWAERFELLVEEELPVTAADFAAVSPAFRDHFRVLPPDTWNDEQMELSEYLKQYTHEPPLAIPFISVTDAQGVPQRAVVTRELINLCRDRQRAWNTFAELAGAQRKKPDNEDREQKAKLEGATQAIYRVVSMLTAPMVTAPMSTAPVEQASLPVPPPVQTQTPQAPLEAAATEDPYIDSFLCTSCNDCFKINPRLFQYDGNKQAFIADARAGTFAELVKAAEGCPAKCIHPGTPRPDDATVTPQLLAKAAKLR